jgi:cytoskeleton protein RodZ
MAAEAGGDIRAGIGTRLRAAREKKGLTLLQAAERMHVDARIVESLEAENFAALGAPVYARGHLRHYAELVDESAAELQQLYADATRAAPAQPDLTRIARMEPSNDSGKLVGPAVIGLVAIALVGTVWWVLTQSVDKVQPTPVHNRFESNTAGSNSGPGAGTSQTTPATAANTGAGSESPVALPAPTPEPSPQRGQKGAGSKGGAPGPTPGASPKSAAPPSARTAAANAALPASGAKVPAAAKSAPPTAANTAPLPAATGATTATSNATAPPPARRAKDGELTLKFSSDSWAEVYDASGQRLFYDVGAAASAHTVRGPAPLRVILGNASGVAVEYNGRPALIPAAVQPDGSARFVINAHGRAVPASPASDGD